ncbi:MAG: hypothetical protein CMM07_20760 [Rhodopirellula sp.]|nr:hypothetical protein [Rhodopirellula sp.]
MATITFIARRSLIAGHIEGEQVVFELPLSRASANRSPRRFFEEAKSLSGRRMTRLMHREDRRSLQTPPFRDESLRAQIVEFLDSVAAGEVWTLDLYGTPSSPDLPQAFIIQGDYNETLVDQTGFWRYTWQAVEA